ncbi:MAG: L-glutamate gamma-semialdehyde dehydrogenase [Deltaproteobacteria bacterium]|nr:L-glutamate gamma-semialdehyde dehydrogenase [Deltaproteobacteria bacterium]
MIDSHAKVPFPTNEPVLDFAPGSPERAELKQALDAMASEEVEIPVVVKGEQRRAGEKVPVVMPHDHGHVLGYVHQASAQDVSDAIAASQEAAPAWRAMPFAERAAIFLRAAELLAGRHRAQINAACMLGQSKTCYQSEIDAVCELVDFWRYNVAFAEEIYQEQPESAPGIWNRTDHRPLEGFVFAVTPFNFLSIALNIPTAPALMGNSVLWKPANTSALGAWYGYELLREAGLPDGVISFLPGEGPVQGDAALASEHLAGLHFTGSTKTFRTLYKGIAQNLEHYRSIPRVVGETGGKDFIVAHPSADAASLATAIVRGAFEYQGQKCSAASRAYIPKSLWPSVRDDVLARTAELRVGDVRDFGNFMGAVIDKRAFDKIDGYFKLAQETAKVLTKGAPDDSKGYFIPPTVVQVDDPAHRLMKEEIFGPMISVYVYDDAKFDEVLELTDTSTPYGLTGAIFARDRAAIVKAMEKLRFAAGNFYINDKPTGAVVGQQPFGGGRASGTNDKAGSASNLLRWLSPRSIKETLVPPRDHGYPFLAKE